MSADQVILSRINVGREPPNVGFRRLEPQCTFCMQPAALRKTCTGARRREEFVSIYTSLQESCALGGIPLTPVTVPFLSQEPYNFPQGFHGQNLTCPKCVSIISVFIVTIVIHLHLTLAGITSESHSLGPRIASPKSRVTQRLHGSLSKSRGRPIFKLSSWRSILSAVTTSLHMSVSYSYNNVTRRGAKQQLLFHNRTSRAKPASCCGLLNSAARYERSNYSRHYLWRYLGWIRVPWRA